MSNTFHSYCIVNVLSTNSVPVAIINDEQIAHMSCQRFTRILMVQKCVVYFHGICKLCCLFFYIVFNCYFVFENEREWKRGREKEKRLEPVIEFTLQTFYRQLYKVFDWAYNSIHNFRESENDTTMYNLENILQKYKSNEKKKNRQQMTQIIQSANKYKPSGFSLTF